MSHEAIVEEERHTRKRHRDLAKARRVRQQNAESATWRKVREYRRLHGCACDLRPKMSLDELLDLGPGCTGLRSEGGSGAGYVCPVLDLYRSLVRR